jgi:hypothetical protein
MSKLNPFVNHFCQAASRAQRCSVFLTLLGVVSLTSVAVADAQPAPGRPRYAVVALDPRTSAALVQDAATGKTFQFVLNDRRLLSALKIGSAVGFDRSNGLMVQGLPGHCCRPIKPPPFQPPQINCSQTPQLCPGGKPPSPKQMLGTQGDFIDQLNDFCTDSPDQCVPGPM